MIRSTRRFVRREGEIAAFTVHQSAVDQNHSQRAGRQRPTSRGVESASRSGPRLASPPPSHRLRPQRVHQPGLARFLRRKHSPLNQPRNLAWSSPRAERRRPRWPRAAETSSRMALRLRPPATTDRSSRTVPWRLVLGDAHQIDLHTEAVQRGLVEGHGLRESVEGQTHRWIDEHAITSAGQ